MLDYEDISDQIQNPHFPDHRTLKGKVTLSKEQSKSVTKLI